MATSTSTLELPLDTEATLMQVGDDFDPTTMARAIARMVREGKSPTLQAIGMTSVDQAVKAVILAQEFLIVEGIRIGFVPVSDQIQIGDQEKTVLALVIERHHR